MKRIAILTGQSLARNPRVLKEGMTLACAGYEVTVIGASPDVAALDIDIALGRRHNVFYESVVPPPQRSLLARFRWLWIRIRIRVANEFFRLIGVQSRWQLGPSISELLAVAKKIDADYYIAHLEQGAWVGTRLLRAGYRVGADFEDWYSEDLNSEDRRHRPLRLLRDVERELLNNSVHVTCPSKAMSKALSETYNCRAPTVIYNAFRWSDRSSIDGLHKDRTTRTMVSIHWFSQTIGSDRGLDDLLGALPLLDRPVELHLRGNPAAGFKEWLAKTTPPGWIGRIVLHELVSNGELLSRIAEHDIGFAGETNHCRNRDLTVTNKILYYLLAGLAVVASDTLGQQEIASEAPGAIFVYRSGNAADLAKKINALLQSADALDCAKQFALRAAQDKFCWEKQGPFFLETIERAIGASSSSNFPG